MIRDSGRRIGEVVAGAVNLLDPPRRSSSGGDIAGAYDIFVAGMRETLYGNAISTATQTLQILPWAYGDRSGMIGCASMTLDQVLSVGGGRPHGRGPRAAMTDRRVQLISARARSLSSISCT